MRRMRRVPRQVPTGIRLMCRHRLVAVAAIDRKRRVESHRVKGVGWRYWYESGPLDASRSKTPKTPAVVSAIGRFEGQDTTSGCATAVGMNAVAGSQELRRPIGQSGPVVPTREHRIPASCVPHSRATKIVHVPSAHRNPQYSRVVQLSRCVHTICTRRFASG
jgi:hypothetical protein